MKDMCHFYEEIVPTSHIQAFKFSYINVQNRISHPKNGYTSAHNVYGRSPKK